MATGEGLRPPHARLDIVDLLVAGGSGIAFAITALFLCVVPLIGKVAGGRDFTVYWATGQQLVHHANPYDASAMIRIEHSAGFISPGALFMRNPPWALGITLPLGLIGVRVGALLWALLLLTCLIVSVRMLWWMHGRPKNQLHWLGYSFPPALLCMIMGQTTIFSLLGYVLFLYYHRTRPFVAGVSLWLCALKPQLFLPFGIVLLAWVAISKSYKIFVGAATALAASCAVTYVIAPTAWMDYSRMMHGSKIANELIPCPSVYLRHWLSPQATWLQYLLGFLSCIWALSYYWKRRRDWEWTKDGGVLMLVSLITAPYCWIYDQCLLIPALLQGVYQTRSRALLAILAVLGLLVNAEFCTVRITTAGYLWTAPIWLAWYLLSGASAEGPRTTVSTSR
jgi:hypothetical protein